MANTGIVNVLLHGAFGYHFTADYIEAHAPAICMHIHKVSASRDLSKAVSLPRADFELSGVVENGISFPPNGEQSPVVPLQQGTQIDEFGKRYCTIYLPYPNSPNQVWPLDPYEVGDIFAGRDAAPLNSVTTNFPSMHAFSYERDGSPLTLLPYSGSGAIRNGDVPDPIDLDSLYSDAPSGYTNIHIWCTTPPKMTNPMPGPAMPSPEGHLRRSFAGLIDLFSTLEITIEIPDGFTPAQTLETLPPGVGCLDVDPSRKNCNSAEIKPRINPRLLYGHVNCHYANIITVDSD